jgi:hypothetical protein
MTNLNDFAEWQAEKPESRSIKIELNPNRYGATDRHSFWVYDHDLQEGQIVSCVAEIDLEGKKQRSEMEKLAELKAKYEGMQEVA